MAHLTTMPHVIIPHTKTTPLSRAARICLQTTRSVTGEVLRAQSLFVNGATQLWVGLKVKGYAGGGAVRNFFVWLRWFTKEAPDHKKGEVCILCLHENP